LNINKLLNLDLGKEFVYKEFTVGPFKIKLVDDYTELQPKIKQGVNCITAITESEIDVDSLLLSDKNKKGKGIWDLCFILSYLTGRRCSLPGFEQRFSYVKQGDNIVDINDLPNAAQIAWSNRHNFIREGRPLYYYLGIIDTAVIQYQALLGCIALEIIQRLEINTIPKNFQIEKLRKRVNWLINIGKLDPDLKSDLKSTTGLWGRKGYYSGLKELLIKYNLISGKEEGESKKRIKSVAKIRNDIVHGNPIEYPKWIKGDREKEKEYVFICSVFIPSLVVEYLNQQFGLKKFYKPIINFENLGQYIHHGKWQSMNILTIIK